jgi:Lon protease-like protein
MSKSLPMFPLGTVLFPHAVLPLHIFEDRYRALAETCLRGDGRFGIAVRLHTTPSSRVRPDASVRNPWKSPSSTSRSSLSRSSC